MKYRPKSKFEKWLLVLSAYLMIGTLYLARRMAVGLLWLLGCSFAVLMAATVIYGTYQAGGWMAVLGFCLFMASAFALVLVFDGARKPKHWWDE